MQRNNFRFFSLATLLILASTHALGGVNSLDSLKEISVRAANAEGLDLSRSSVLGQQTLEGRQVHSLSDLNGLSPTLHLSGNGIMSFGDVLSIRGIGNTQFFGSPGVQMYIDGVPQGNVFSYPSNLSDFESLEINKGPQGNRFGKLAPGGSINLITRKPGDVRVSKFKASYATFNTQKYNLATSAPVDDEFSYSFAGQRSKSDGFLNNTSGRDNDSKSWNGRLNFYWDGGHGTKAALGASLSSHELGAQALVLRDGGDFYNRSVDFDESTKIDQDQQYLKIEHATDWGKFLSTTNRNDWNMNPNRLDIDLSTTSGATSTIRQELKSWGQEILALSSTDGSFQWRLGSNFHSTDTQGTATRWYIFPYPVNTLVPSLGPGATLTPNANFNNTTESTTYLIKDENFAIFTEFIKDISDENSLEIGLRYDRSKNSLTRDKLSDYPAFTFASAVNPNLAFDVPSPATSISSNPLRLSKDSSLFSPSIQLNHLFSDVSSSFLKVSNSGKPGGFSAFTDSESNASFNKEQVFSYEIGFEYFPSESWSISLNGYLNDVKDYQMEMPEPGSTNYSLVNVDEVTIYGIEINSAMKLDGGWRIALGFGLTDSEIRDITELSIKSSALSNLKNQQVSFVPRYTLSTMIGHELDNGVYYQLGTRTVGESFYWDQTGLNNTDRIASYTLLDAKIGTTYEDWQIDIFGSNLTNVEYYTSLVSSLSNLGAAPGVVGSPRVIGLSISKQF